MRDIFILNEVPTQDKLYIFGRQFAWLKYFTYYIVPALAPYYKHHILPPAKVRKICYSLAESYVRSVYLNLLGWREA
jgi:hypothetical protein